MITRPGRTVQIWGGKDVVIKSQGATDISSSSGDVRLKAEKNLMLLGGNSGSAGGVLIENRSNSTPHFETTGDMVDVGGLIIKASRGMLGIIGDDVYTKSLSGTMTFDANSTEGSIIMYGREFTKYMRSSVAELLVPEGEETPDTSVSMYEHSSGGTFKIYGSTVKLGAASLEALNHRGSGSAAGVNMSVKGTLSMDGSISATGGVSETKANASSQALYQRLRQELKRELAAANSEFKRTYSEQVGNDTSFGNENVYGLIGVSFRSTEELNLGTMVIYEAAWQRRFRQTAGVKADDKYTTVWDEPIVYGRVTPEGEDDESRPTMPFPGKEGWEDEDGASYVQVDQQFYERDGSGGHPKPRGEKGENYDEVDPPDLSSGAFKDRYPVNKA